MDADREMTQLRRQVAVLQQRLAELESHVEDADSATAALQQSEERFAKIFRASPVAVVISTMTEGRYVEVNQRFIDFTGYSRSEVIGHTSTEIGIWARQDDRYKVGEVLEKQEFVRDRELTFRAKSGQVLTVLASFEVIELDSVTCVLTMCQDITERKRAAVELERLYLEAQEAVRGRDDFLSVAAHELRTPVTSLRGYTQLLGRILERGEELDPGRTQKALTVIDNQADKLVRFVNRLLDLSRIQAGQMILSRQPTDLSRLVEEVGSTMQGLTTRHTITIHAAPAIVVTVDPLRFEQVLTNLIDNAQRYSPTGGHIQIELSRPTREIVEIIIADQGLGVPPEHREHIFDRFYRAHQRSDGGGLGLGLYIAQQIVTLHGGDITVETPAGGGTRFRVSLPVVQELDDAAG